MESILLTISINMPIKLKKKGSLEIFPWFFERIDKLRINWEFLKSEVILKEWYAKTHKMKTAEEKSEYFMHTKGNKQSVLYILMRNFKDKLYNKKWMI